MTTPSTVTRWPASGVAVPVPCTCAIVCVGAVAQVGAGSSGSSGSSGVAVPFNRPKLFSAGPCQVPPIFCSECPIGALVSTTPMSTLVAPATVSVPP